MDEAIAAPSGSSGILCNVTVVDDSHEITGNGVYYLGLTNSSYVLYTDEEQKDVTVCVIGTNAYSRPGSTVTPGVVSMSSGIAGVTLKLLRSPQTRLPLSWILPRGRREKRPLMFRLEDCVGK